VKTAASKLVDRARAGGGPGFLEAVTFRWFGHVDWREDVDVGVARSADDIAQWRKRDPVRRLAEGLELAGAWSAERNESMLSELRTEITEAWQQALADPWPPESALLARVYHRGSST
jgi:pyruvate dehydrogenase E1 component alpha subunit